MVIWKAVLMFLNSGLKFYAIFFIAIQAIIMPVTAANIWSGRVVYVVDGDTIHVQSDDGKGKNHLRKIRIEGIDAPEVCQLYGAESRAALKKYLLKQQVTVSTISLDDYGRELAKITFNNDDVGSWMVRNGYAWSYHSKFSAGPYRADEALATRSRLGLFASGQATEPRIFRREQGSCYTPRSKNDRKRDN